MMMRPNCFVASPPSRVSGKHRLIRFCCSRNVSVFSCFCLQISQWMLLLVAVVVVLFSAKQDLCPPNLHKRRTRVVWRRQGKGWRQEGGGQREQRQNRQKTQETQISSTFPSLPKLRGFLIIFWFSPRLFAIGSVG